MYFQQRVKNTCTVYLSRIVEEMRVSCRTLYLGEESKSILLQMTGHEKYSKIVTLTTSINLEHH